MEINLHLFDPLVNSPRSSLSLTLPSPRPLKNKRNFDVAFLVAPDERLAQRKEESSRLTPPPEPDGHGERTHALRDEQDEMGVVLKDAQLRISPDESRVVSRPSSREKQMKICGRVASERVEQRKKEDLLSNFSSEDNFFPNKRERNCLPQEVRQRRMVDKQYVTVYEDKLLSPRKHDKVFVVDTGTLVKRASPPHITLPHVSRQEWSNVDKWDRQDDSERSYTNFTSELSPSKHEVTFRARTGSAFKKITSSPTAPNSISSPSPDMAHLEDSVSPVAMIPPFFNIPSDASLQYWGDAANTHIKNDVFNPRQASFPEHGGFIPISSRSGIDSFLLKASNMSSNLYGHTNTVSEREFIQLAHRGREKSNLFYNPDPMSYTNLGVTYPFAGGFPFPPDMSSSHKLLNSATMAAFSLTAQNICAKCNVGFRMTSDLVYHMRSHHKGENSVGDLSRRKDRDKLKCEVCSESFRERHHLTRHMTAHQDKDGDLEEMGGRRGRGQLDKGQETESGVDAL